MTTTNQKIHALIQWLVTLRQEMIDLETSHDNQLAHIHDNHRHSARNLLHYVALRRHDLRETQIELAQLGLSSLGHCESWSLANIEAVIRVLRVLSAEGSAQLELNWNGVGGGLLEGKSRIDFNAAQLLGPSPNGNVRIMVTMPTSAADDYALVHDLLAGGMDCMRINCAHDNPETWRKMIGHLSKAKLELNRPCKICMDLAGPNPRTKLFDSSDTSRKLVLGDRIRLAKKQTGQTDMVEIGCSCPEIISDLKVNERLFIDDGKFGAIVRDTSESWVEMEITRVSPEGKKIKKEKGLNAPDSQLSFSSLTEFDREVLPFVVEHGDIVGMSFIRHPDDIFELNDELHRLNGDNLGLLLKIETVPAFRLFPRLLLAGMRRPKVGVMIARGDMAVESGYERLAEIQEEILWFCEAAHMPVVWATEVLRSFVKTGLPGRGEITDAAMGGRAECVMLNKGPFIVEAVRSLADILTRMRAHQSKKRSMLRRLAVSDTFHDWHMQESNTNYNLE